MYLKIGRCSLEKMEKSSDVFISEFSTQVATLIPHDFIAKKQAEYLNARKEDLRRGEFIVISDFAENYSFIIQVFRNKNYFLSSFFNANQFFHRMPFNRTTGTTINVLFIHSRSITGTTTVSCNIKVF